MLIRLAAAIVVVHLACLAFIPLGGLLALRRPRLIWMHLVQVVFGACVVVSYVFVIRRRRYERSRH